MPAAAKIDLSSLPEDQRDVVADLLREHADLLAVVHGKKSAKLSKDDR